MTDWSEIPCDESGSNGYGAHRSTWIAANGPVPSGMLICHRCDNPPCHELAHLFLGTQTDNMRDAADKGRMRGLFEAGHTRSRKLTEDEYADIRARYADGRTLRHHPDPTKASGTELALEYGLHVSTICLIAKGFTALP